MDSWVESSPSQEGSIYFGFASVSGIFLVAIAVASYTRYNR